MGTGRGVVRAGGGTSRQFSGDPFDSGESGRQVVAGDLGIGAGPHFDEEHVARSNQRARKPRVSAVIARFAVHVPLIRRGDASIALAIRFCEIPIGLRNSLKRTFPG
jgi:hypothetical protein